MALVWSDVSILVCYFYMSGVTGVDRGNVYNCVWGLNVCDSCVSYATAGVWLSGMVRNNFILRLS